MKRVQSGEAQGELAKRPEFNVEPLVESYGRLPAWRIRRAAGRFALEHLRTDLRIIPLEEGERLQFAGLSGLDMTYIGISGGKSVFRSRAGAMIENQLMRASRGLRYDIFVGQYWTREAVKMAFPGAGANFDAVSRVQALELLVYDKRTGTAEHSWLSLGANKEKVLGDQSLKAEIRTEKMLPRIRTEKLPELPKATRKSIMPASMPLSEPVAKSFSLPLATALVSGAVQNYLSLALTVGPAGISTHSMFMNIGGHLVKIVKEAGKVVIAFNRSGHEIREEVEIAGQTGRELAEGYRVAFRGFPLDNNSRGEVCDYVVLATVISPANEVDLFVLGGRG